MNEKVQIIKQDGRPAFAVLPYEDYKALVDALEDARDAGLIEAFHAKLARGDEELIPEEYAERLIGGENPVRVWRELRGMTLQQVADACGVTDSAISMIEQGKRQPSVDLLKKLAAALGIEADDLL
jgi:DNA-binding XRE family transcriptional regulator